MKFLRDLFSRTEMHQRLLMLEMHLNTTRKEVNTLTEQLEATKRANQHLVKAMHRLQTGALKQLVNRIDPVRVADKLRTFEKTLSAPGSDSVEPARKNQLVGFGLTFGKYPAGANDEDRYLGRIEAPLGPIGSKAHVMNYDSKVGCAPKNWTLPASVRDAVSDKILDRALEPAVPVLPADHPEVQHQRRRNDAFTPKPVVWRALQDHWDNYADDVAMGTYNISIGQFRMRVERLGKAFNISPRSVKSQHRHNVNTWPTGLLEKAATQLICEAISVTYKEPAQ